MRSNPKAFQTIALNLKALEGVQAQVGWFSTSKYPSGTPVAYAAALNELGHGKTPPRPFIRPTIVEKAAQWGKTIAAGARAVIAGKASPEAPLKAVAIEAQEDIVGTINKIFQPALSPVTIELRAMRKRDPSLKITGATVGEAARRVAEPGYKTPNVSTKPLIDTGLLVATITNVVEKTK